MAVTVTHVQAGGYPASVDRAGRAALLVKSGAANKVRTGILPFNGAELLPGPSTPTPDMHTVVTPGCAVIPDSAGGAYIFVSDATVTLNHTASSGTNPRTDLIIARVYDNEAGDATATSPLVLPGTAGSVNVETITGAVEIVTGVAGVGAPVPALPNSPAGSRCIVLAQVTVGTSVTSITAGNIATTAAVGRPGRTVATGGILPVLTEAEIAGLAQHEGQVFDAADTDRLLRSNGAAAAVVADPSVFTAWTAYTPVLTASTTSPTLGTSTLVGRYKQIGKTVYYQIRLTIGTGYAAGTGFYTVTLPPVAANATSFPAEQAVGVGSVQQSTTRKQLIATVWTSGSIIMSRCSNEALVDSTGVGLAWATGHILTVTGTYEAA